MRNPVFTDVLENELKILSTLHHKNSQCRGRPLRLDPRSSLPSRVLLRFSDRSVEKAAGLSNHHGIRRWVRCTITRGMSMAFFSDVCSGSLSQHLAKFGQFQEPVIRNYTRQLLEGLQYLHENHILHRDIKSANILVNSKGYVEPRVALSR